MTTSRIPHSSQNLGSQNPGSRGQTIEPTNKVGTLFFETVETLRRQVVELQTKNEQLTAKCTKLEESNAILTFRLKNLKERIRRAPSNEQEGTLVPRSQETPNCKQQ